MKDIFGFAVYMVILNFFFILFMNLFFVTENFIEANTLVTPVHIQPEGYFLASYAIHRSIPKKLGGCYCFGRFNMYILYYSFY